MIKRRSGFPTLKSRTAEGRAIARNQPAAWMAVTLLGITMTLTSACQRRSNSNDTPAANTLPATAQKLPIKADLDLASGDEQAVLRACTRVASLVLFLWNGRDDWAGTSAASQPWFNEKVFDKQGEEIGRLMKWIADVNAAELDKYAGKPSNESVVEMMRENGWPDANPAVPFQLSEESWQALGRRLLLCAYLFEGRVPDSTPEVASVTKKPPRATDTGDPPMILEVEQE